MMYRHGDLLIKSTDRKVKGRGARSVVLADGEATGHQHVLVSAKPILATYEASLPVVISLEENGTLTHPEHDTLTIEPGTYEIVREREYDYFSEETKKVLD